MSEKKEAWRSILIFLVILALLSSIFQYALVNLYPSRLYIGALMWCPAIAAFITLKLNGRSISSLNWSWGDGRYIRLAYFIPALYGIATYLLIWLFGFGSFASDEVLVEWGNEIGLTGIGSLNPTAIVITAVLLLGTVGVIRSAATTFGEEIGWRGYFIYELRKVLSFTGVSVFSGIVWATWHWPVIVYYGSNVALEMATFYVVIVSMSFIMTYFTFKSNSLWPAVIFHAVSNVYIQKTLPPLTIETEGLEHWHGEYGIMFAIVTGLFGIYYWRKGVLDKL